MKFDPQKSLFDLTIVRGTIIIVLLLSFSVALIIMLHTKKPIDFSGDGFNEAVSLYRVPLGILAIGLTLVGIYGANHRSEQTKRQIERSLEQIKLTNAQIKITETQNIFANYYKHIEEFTKYCDVHEGAKRYKGSRQLYSKIFDKSAQGDYTISEIFLSDFNLFMAQILEASDDLTSHIGVRDGIKKIVVLRSAFAEKLKLINLQESLSGSEFSQSGRSYIIPGDNSVTTIKSVSFIIESIDIALRFDPKYIPTREANNLKDIELKYISPVRLSEQANPFNLRKLAHLSEN